MKKLSVIIPVYNVQKYLEKCLESIIISDKDLEIIIIDDGSIDNSPKICDEYEKKDKRVKVYHKKNGGVSSARNYGLKLATGDYVTFIDSDDVLAEDWDKIIDYIEDDDIYYYNPLINENINKEKMITYITGANKEQIYISGVYSKAFKREFLIRSKLKFKEDLINGEDMIYNIEAILLAKTFRTVNINYYYYYRQTIGQATRRFDTKILNSDKSFHKYLNDLFEKYNVNENIAINIKEFCLSNAVIMILNRISYMNSFKNAKKYFYFLSQEPYEKAIRNLKNHNFIFELCRRKKYKFIYYYLRYRNRLAISLKYKLKRQLIGI